jgi:hypothetical protein
MPALPHASCATFFIPREMSCDERAAAAAAAEDDGAKADVGVGAGARKAP